MSRYKNFLRNSFQTCLLTPHILLTKEEEGISLKGGSPPGDHHLRDLVPILPLVLPSREEILLRDNGQHELGKQHFSSVKII